MMDKFVTRLRDEHNQPHTDDSESASNFELQPPPRKTAVLAGDSTSSDDQWSRSSSSSSGSNKMRTYKDKLSYNLA